MNKCKDLVTDILTEKPKTRDSDVLLFQEVWKQQAEKEIGNIDLTDCKVSLLFKLMTNKKISRPSTIKRIRAKLQEICPNLRGKVYEQRHGYQEKVKEELRLFDAEVANPSYGHPSFDRIKGQ